MGQVGVANRERARTRDVRWRRVALGIALGICALAGRGAAIAAPPPSTIPERRLALAAELQTTASAAERVPLAWKLAELEESAGNPDLAVRAEGQALRNAGVAALVGGLLGNADAASAAARLHDAVARAIALGARAGAWELVLDALAWEPAEAANHLDVVRRALLARAYHVSTHLREQLRSVLDAEPIWRAYLEKAWNLDEPLIDDAALVRAGELGVDVLGARLGNALREEDLTRARKLVDLLGQADPQHLRGRVARLLFSDARAVSLLTPKEVAATLSEVTASSTVIARLARLQKAHPDDLSLTIALAYRLQTVHLFADAHREADRVARAPQASEELRSTALEISAFADLEAQRDQDVLRWSRSNGAAPSAWFARQVLGLRPLAALHSKPPSALQREALRRIFSEAFTPALADLQITWAARAALVLDDREGRQRALAVLHEIDRPAEQQVRTCLRASVAAEECENRLGLIDSLATDDDDDYDARDEGINDPGGAIDLVRDMRASWLSTLAHIDPAKLSAVEPKLARLRTERYLGTPDLVHLEIAVASARRDWPAARAVLDRWGAALSAHDRLEIRLLLDHQAKAKREKSAAKNAKPARIPSLLSADRQFLPKTDKDPTNENDEREDDEDADEDDGAHDAEQAPSKLAAALYRWTNHPQDVIDRLTKIWKRYDSGGGAELAAWRWLAAQRAGRLALAREAMARLERIAPASAAALRVKTDDALTRGRADEALRLAARFWLAAPESAAASQLFAIAWVRATPNALLSAQQRAWIRRADDVAGPGEWRPMTDALDQDVVHARGDLTAIVDGVQRTERLLDAPPSWNDQIWFYWWCLGQLDTRPAKDVAAFAARVAAHLARPQEKPPDTPLFFWAPYLAGDYAAAASALHSATHRRDKRGSFVIESDPKIEAQTLLLDLHQPPDVALRQSMYRALNQRPIGNVDLPEQLAQRATSTHDLQDAAALRELACLSAAQLGRVRQAIALCSVAWRKVARTSSIATSLADLIANDPDAAHQEGFDAETFFREAREALGAHLPAQILHDQSMWLGKLRRRNDAANLEVEAWLAGFQLNAAGLRLNAFQFVRPQPLLARVEEGAIMYGADRDMRLGALALAAADLDVAAIHLQAALSAPAIEDDHKQWVATFLDLTNIARIDLAQKQIDFGTYQDMTEAYFDGTWTSALPGLLRRAPRSLFLGTLSATVSFQRAQIPTDALMTTLQRACPDNNLTVQGMVAAWLVLTKHADRAAALLARLRAAYPGDKRLDKMSVLTDGKPVEVPKWAATPEALDDALAKADLQPLLAKEPHFERAKDGTMDAYLPEGFSAELPQKFTFRRSGLLLTGYRAPRVTHCLPAACLDELAAELKQQNIELLWSHPTRLPIGEGQEGMFKGPAGLVLAVAIPTGPHVFYISAVGPTDQMAGALPAIRFFRDTFRTSDIALGPKRTSLVLPNIYQYNLAPVTGARARLAMATGKGTGCPIGAALADLEPAQRRSDLILELYLATRDPADRVRLLACVSPGLLPPGAITQLVAANLPGLPAWGLRPPNELLEATHGMPPIWLWRAAEAIAFGWYAADPGGGPERWAVVMPWSAAIERAWNEHHLPAPSVRAGAAGDLHFVRQGDFLALSSNAALLAALHVPATAPPTPPAVVASVSGPALAAALEQRARRAGADSPAAAEMGAWQSLAAMIGSFETRATARDGVLTSETWLRTSFPADARGASSIDEWLRSRRLKNALHLPHAIDEQLAAKPVVLVVRANRSEDVRRAFPGTDRLSVTDAGPQLFRVRVLPAPSTVASARLTDGERRRFVDGDGASAPPLRSTARDVVGTATSAWDRARAVVTWVQREMTYEITPRYIDNLTLLGTKRGDCTEYAQLTVALLRALDVPARVRTGMLVSGTSLVAHAWAEFHDGNAWHEVDPTAGRTSVDASYVDASVMDLLPLLLDGRIEVTAIETL